MKQGLCKYVRYSLVCLSLGMIIWGIVFRSFNNVLVGIAFIYIQNIIYCFEKIQTRIYLLMFYIMIFVFLLSRPFVSLVEGKVWWDNSNIDGTIFSLAAISISIVCLQTGAFLIERKKTVLSCKNIETSKGEFKEQFNKNLGIVSQIIFYASAIFVILLEIEKLVYMHGRTYVEYYVSFHSNASGIMHLLAAFMPYSLCIFLATMPEKRRAVIPLGIYWMCALPDLIIGMRNPIMLRSIFVFLYFFMRDIQRDKEKWIGKLERTILIITVPFVLIFMAAYSSLRSGQNVSGQGVGALFINFFYGQGVSFDVLGIGYKCIPLLPERAFRNYTFGGIIDYFQHGSFAQKFFGAQPLGGGNDLTNALLSNSFAHNMSYIAKGDKYLAGEGWGSSYLLETYTDYGYWGIIVFSLLLGALLVYGTYTWKKNSFSKVITMLILTKIFFAPRGAATEFVEFLVTAQFWFLMMVCYFGAALCCKRYEKQKI